MAEEMIANTLGELVEYLSKRFDVSYAKLARIVVKTAKWQKEQMLKDAVEGKAVELGETYKDLSISVGGKELNEVLQPLGVKDGDKVKVIIMKEAEK